MEIVESILVPGNFSEEKKVLPWVFHNDQQYKIWKLDCIMRKLNVSENPQWSYQGFRDSQVDTSGPALIRDDQGVPFAICSIKVNTSSLDAGKKSATCEFQQENLSMSIDFQFLIFRKSNKTPDKITSPVAQNFLLYDLGGNLDEKSITQQVEDKIKRQISEYYNIPASSASVFRSRDAQALIVLAIKADTTSNTTTSSNILEKNFWMYLGSGGGIGLLVLSVLLLVCVRRKKRYGEFTEHYGGRVSLDSNLWYGESEEYYLYQHEKRKTQVADENELYGYPC